MTSWRSQPSVELPEMRDRGDGSFYQEATGRWAAVVSTPLGRRKRYVPARLARTKKEGRAAAKALLTEMLADLDVGVVGVSGRLTLSAYLRGWLARREEATTTTRRRGKVRPATMRHLEMIVRVHIDPTLGKIPLARLRRPQIADWLDGMSGSPRSIDHRVAVLRNALNAAVERGLIRANPAVGLELPNVPRRIQPTLDGEQAAMLVRGTADDRLNALWALAIATGLRISELLGLAWTDWQGTTLRVHSQLARYQGQYVLADTKAARSRETITLPAFAVVALERHRIRMAAERLPTWERFGLVFVTEKGQPFYEQRALREFYRTLERLELPRVRLHGLRYSNASILEDEGVPEDVRMGRLGHSTRKMARQYAKVGDAPDQAAADALDRVISR